MNTNIRSLIFPVILTLAGIFLVILAYATEQNTFFKIGTFAIFLVGVISILNALEVVTKVIKLALVSVLVLMAVGLAALDYKSIKDPIDFQKIKDKRYNIVKQRLKDIRTAQIAYKAVHKEYAANFDSLLHFVKYDSFPVVMSLGTVPDTLSEDSALLLGIVVRDTITMSVKDSIFSKHYLAKRDVKQRFQIDSLPYIPFSGGEQFNIEAGEIVRNNVPVKVFQVEAPNSAILNGLSTQFYHPKKGLQIGSMTEPTTSGNWGE